MTITEACKYYSELPNTLQDFLRGPQCISPNRYEFSTELMGGRTLYDSDGFAIGTTNGKHYYKLTVETRNITGILASIRAMTNWRPDELRLVVPAIAARIDWERMAALLNCVIMEKFVHQSSRLTKILMSCYPENEWDPFPLEQLPAFLKQNTDAFIPDDVQAVIEASRSKQEEQITRQMEWLLASQKQFKKSILVPIQTEIRKGILNPDNAPKPSEPPIPKPVVVDRFAPRVIKLEEE